MDIRPIFEVVKVISLSSLMQALDLLISNCSVSIIGTTLAAASEEYICWFLLPYVS